MTGRRHPRLRDYFRVTPLSSTDQIAASLWSDVGPGDYAGESKLAYQAALLAQYELYVEMADRVSARRATANAFFVTLNTGVFALLAGFWESERSDSTVLLCVASAALVLQ